MPTKVEWGKDPMYDRYEGENSDHRKKKYTKVIALPGRPEQAAEFNEIQTIARDYNERLGQSIFREGAIVSGVALSITGNSVSLSSGRIFLNKLIRETDEATLSITGVGLERIYAYMETTYVTEDDDSTLRDPAQGMDNFGIAGAYRQKEEVKFGVAQGDSIDVDGAVQIYLLQDGSLVTNNNGGDESTPTIVDDKIAEQNYDENGNYRVYGLKLQENLEKSPNGGVKVYISAGEAYIRGYKVVKEAMSSVTLNASTSTRRVQGETHRVIATSNAELSRYRLSNGPIDHVDEFTCQVQRTKEKLERTGYKGGADALPYTPVHDILRVYSLDESGNETVYQEGRDYVRYGDLVDWSPNSDDALEPTLHTSYYIDYVYDKTMVKDTDYTISNERNNAYLTILLGEGHVSPVVDSYFNITYYYTLARRDLILLDRTGLFSVKEGTPDRIDDLITPYNGSDDFLELGYVDVYPTDALNPEGNDKSYLGVVTGYNDTRLTQENFFTMLQRVEALEDSIAQLDLERQATTGEELTSLNGYFTDNFMNYDKSDTGYQGNITSPTVISKYTAGLDPNRGVLTTGADFTNTAVDINTTSSSALATYEGRIVSPAYELLLGLQQTYATGISKVNPYASYGPMCQVTLDPYKDTWVDSNQVTQRNSITNEVTEVETRNYSHYEWRGTGRYHSLVSSSTTDRNNGSYVTTSTTQGSSVQKTIFEYMRQRDVDVTGRAFLGNMKNIHATFNGIPVDLISKDTERTPQGEDWKSVNGGSYKTVNADANGSFYAKFTVPDLVPCGKVDVVFTGYSGDEGHEYTGKAVYEAEGTLITTTITDTTVYTTHHKVLRETTNTYESDPLAQSFILSDTYDRCLIELGLYFASKSESRPAVLQIRNMVNGYPGETVYAEVSILPNDINIPTDKDKPVETRIHLNQPVFCRKGVYYCFVVLSDSNDYSMYYAKMGDNILGTDEALVINPYDKGVMFSSSNASTWTAHQDSDLKFDLYRSRFAGNAEIIFDDVSLKDVTGVFLDAVYENEAGQAAEASLNRTDIKWTYRFRGDTTNAWSEWLPIDTLTYRDLGTTTSVVSLRAEIQTDYTTSPFIDKNAVTLKTFVDDKQSVYISRSLDEMEFAEQYQALKISYDAELTGGATADLYYMDTEPDRKTSDYTYWHHIETGDNVELSVKQVDEETKRYTWNVKKVNTYANHPELGGSKYFKLAIILTTPYSFNRPRLSDLTCIFKYDMGQND